LLARASDVAGTPSPQILINSVDYWAMRRLLDARDDAGLADMLVRDLEALQRAGAGVALIAANTPHMVFDAVQARVSLPLVSIVTATADAAAAQGLTRPGLLGTRFTMRGRFFGDVFAARGMTIVVPEAADVDYVHDVYVNELVQGQFLDSSRAGLVAVMDRLRTRGIDGVILGGTELPLILRGVEYPLPVLDTTRIHVEAALEAALTRSVS
jgi:aspartate racemase